jgi:predicted nucleic acid-binding protein
MAQYLIDTNVVSDYLSDSFSPHAADFMDKVIDDTPKISIITQIELMCWSTDADTEQKVNDFIADSLIMDISPDVIIQCVNLRKGKKLKTPDAIIAATALAHGYIVITNNEKDFANIKGLEIVNPHKM